MEKKLKEFLNGLDKERLEAVVGLENKDALRSAFPDTKIIHPGMADKMLAKEQWPSVWSGLSSEKGAPGARAAYIHIPFCRSKCTYCGFFQNFCDDSLESKYIGNLLDEIKMSRSPQLDSVPLQAVYIGGGSPSSLSPANCGRLLRGLREYLPLANDCEITFESRVNDMTGERIDVLFTGGVNRISLGVQTFDTRLRRILGRIDTQEEVLEHLRRLQAYGQAPIVIDLIYGFPSQTMEIWRNDLRLLKETSLDGFDLYHLKLHSNSALQKAIDSGALPPAATMAEKAEMFAEAEAALARYNRLSVCHWAKNGRERSLYNTLSKSGAEIVPFGCGAGGNIAGFSLFQQRDISAYSKMVAEGLKPLMFMGRQSKYKKLFSAVGGQIDAGCLDIDELAGRFGEKVHEIEPLLSIWEARGLLRKEGGAVYLLQPGRFWSVNIAQSLIDCLQAVTEGPQQPGTGNGHPGATGMTGMPDGTHTHAAHGKTGPDMAPARPD